MPLHGLQHPCVSRRTAVQAGAVGLLGLGLKTNRNQLLEQRQFANFGQWSDCQILYLYLPFQADFRLATKVLI